MDNIEKEKRRKKHEEKYSLLCEKHGVAWTEDSCKLVDETVDSMILKFKEDANLNNVPLAKWDRLAAYCGQGLTLCERVCMQKNAARAMLEGVIRERAVTK